MQFAERPEQPEQPKGFETGVDEFGMPVTYVFEKIQPKIGKDGNEDTKVYKQRTLVPPGCHIAEGLSPYDILTDAVNKAEENLSEAKARLEHVLKDPMVANCLVIQKLLDDPDEKLDDKQLSVVCVHIAKKNNAEVDCDIAELELFRVKSALRVFVFKNSKNPEHTKHTTLLRFQSNLAKK